MTLIGLGLVNISEFPFHWFTWWIGDSIGVLVFTPILLCFFHPMKSLWNKRRLNLAAPMILLFLLIVIFFFYARKWEDERVEILFSSRVNNIVRSFETNIQTYKTRMNSIESLFRSFGSVSRNEFSNFVKNYFDKKLGTRAISYNPIITEFNKQSFIKNAGLGLGYLYLQKDHRK